MGTYSRNKSLIYSPKYPSNYPTDGNDCTWNITTLKNNQLHLELLYFKLSICDKKKWNSVKDYVEIFDGISEKSRSLVHLCGNMLDHEGHVWSSATNALFVRFKSKNSGKGFVFQLMVLEGIKKYFLQ